MLNFEYSDNYIAKIAYYTNPNICIIVYCDNRIVSYMVSRNGHDLTTT